MILFWLIKSKIFRDVVLYVTVISVICLAVLYQVGCIEYDTMQRRNQIADRLQEMANQVKADPKNTEALHCGVSKPRQPQIRSRVEVLE